MRIHVIFLLVKAFLDGVKPLKTYFSRLTVPDSSKKGRVIQIVLTALLIFSLGVLLMMLTFNYYTYQTLGVLLGIPHLGMFLACLAGFSFLFFFGSIGLSSIIYGGKDITLASTLPVSEQELLLSRLIIAYVLYFPLYLGIMLPAIAVAAFLQGLSILFLLGSIVLLLLGPLLPLCLALLIATALVRLSKGKRFRMFEQLFSFVLVLGFSLGMITAFSRNLGDSSSFQVDFQAMVASMGSIFDTLTRLFPFFMMQAGMLWVWADFGLQVLLLLALPLVISLAVGRGYARSLSLVSSSQSMTRKKKERRGSYRAMSITQTLIVRDLEVIKGHSVFMIEVVGELFIPLILLGVYALTGVLGELEGMASLVANSPYLPYGLFLGVALLSSMTMLSSTSVSRQGPQFALDKVLPLTPRAFVKAKLVLHLLLVGVTNIVYLSLSLLFFKLSFIHLLWMAPLTLLVIFSIAAFGLAIDYKRPLLDWSIPQQAMKSNMNGLLGMGAALGVLVLVGLALFVPMILIPSPALGIGLAIIVATGLCLFSWKTVVLQASSALCR